MDGDAEKDPRKVRSTFPAVDKSSNGGVGGPAIVQITPTQNVGSGVLVIEKGTGSGGDETTAVKTSIRFEPEASAEGSIELEIEFEPDASAEGSIEFEPEASAEGSIEPAASAKGIEFEPEASADGVIEASANFEPEASAEGIEPEASAIDFDPEPSASGFVDCSNKVNGFEDCVSRDMGSGAHDRVEGMMNVDGDFDFYERLTDDMMDSPRFFPSGGSVDDEPSTWNPNEVMSIPSDMEISFESSVDTMAIIGRDMDMNDFDSQEYLMGADAEDMGDVDGGVPEYSWNPDEVMSAPIDFDSVVDEDLEFDFVLAIGSQDPLTQVVDSQVGNDADDVDPVPVEELEFERQAKLTYKEFLAWKKIGKSKENYKKWFDYKKSAAQKLAAAQKYRLDKRAQRAAETADQRQQRLDLANVNHLNDNQTAHNRLANRKRHAVSQAVSLDNENEQRKSRRLDLDRTQHRLSRQAETDRQREARLEADRAYQQMRRDSPYKKFDATKRDEIEPFSLGLMEFQCLHCEAYHFKCEKREQGVYQSCCGRGTIDMKFAPYPDELKKLLKKEGNPRQWQEFHKNIIKYNTSFSFAYMVGEVGQLPGIFHYVVQGELLQMLPKYLSRGPNQTPAFGSLWILETDDAIDLRMNAPFSRTCSRATFELIQKVLEENNVFVDAYRMLHEIEKEQIDEAALIGKEPPVCRLVFRKTTDNTSNQYTVARSNEVAGIYVSDPDSPGLPWNDITVEPRPRNNQPKRGEVISRHKKEVEPLTFTLLYPTGEGDFWHWERLRNPADPSSKKITAMKYALFKLANRDESARGFNPILYSGKLLSKWIVWSYAIMDNERLRYFRTHQKEIRVDSYLGLNDFLQNEADRLNANPGQIVVLPSSYTHGPRWLSEKFHDSMACVRRFGRPHLFITFTCNPRHPDILDNLLPGQEPQDRPDLVNSVFNFQVKQFIKEMLSGIFGKVRYYVYVVEFQKRGLPHIHSLWTMDETWDDIDKINAFVSAELPDPETDKEGFDLVRSNMMHTPCGIHGSKNMCMMNGKCKRGFPKRCKDDTVIAENGYPDYMRRDMGIRARVKSGDHRWMDVGNEWVVPHNMYLLKKFKSHINIEIVCNLTVVTYLFKYLFKGPDKANVQMVGNTVNYDEIRQYLDCRYLSAHEAAWRLFGYDMHCSNISVEKLQVHMENGQNVTMPVNPTDEQMVNALLQKSKLNAFFELNKVREERGDNSDLTYVNVCYDHVWNANTKTWTKRQNNSKGKCARMYSVNPKNSELFYMRKLLCVVKNPKSFDDLRKDLNDPSKTHSTYREACVARGLVVSDQMYYDAMKEGVFHVTGKALRALWATIVAYCDIEDPLLLWERFKFPLFTDIQYQRHCSRDEAETIAFTRALKLLMRMERTIDEFPSLEYLVNLLNLDLNTDMYDSSHYANLANAMEDIFNVEQQAATTAIVDSINTGLNNCVYVNGPGGTGKSTIFKYIYSKTLSLKKKVIVMAWSGIAASLYENGRTCHNVFKLDFPFLEDSGSKVIPSTELARDLLDIDVIIWDEAPMAPRQSFDVIDKKLREIMNNDKPFGGKVMVLGGDFAQLPPIVKNGIKADVLRNCIKSSPLWKLFEQNTFKLVRNMRAETANAGDNFAEDILKISTGEANDANSKVVIPVNCITQNELITDVFSELIEAKNYDSLTSRAIICTLNEQVDKYNREVVNALDTPEVVYQAVDQVEVFENDELSDCAYSHEYFEMFRPTGFPEFELKLKVNAVIMLIRNLNISQGLCNGTRLMITKLLPNVIICKKLDGSTDNVVMIPRIVLIDESSTAFKVYRHQFPVRVAFALTVNKSQGQTFERIGVDISSGVFSHGHLYVALSRTRAWDRLKVKLTVDSDGPDKTKNIVYPELLVDSAQVIANQPPAETTTQNDENVEELMTED